MKKLSLRLRISLMTFFLIVLTSLSLNFFTNRTAVFYMDSLGGFAQKNDEFYIKEDRMEDFFTNFSGEIKESKKSLSKKTWLITGLISLSGGLISFIISGRALRPLDDFSKKIENAELSNITDSKIKEDQVKEFRKLAKSFNKMLKRLDKSYEKQKEFTARAAHELKTPLTIINSQIDLYRQEGMDKDGLILKIRQESDRLSKLIEKLLQISELETVKRDDDVEISSLIEEIIWDLSPISEKKHIEIKNKSQKAIIKASDVLLYRAFYNIIENSIKYNKPYGHVLIYSKKTKDSINIYIKDSGPGIRDKDKEKIFDPFFRGSEIKEKGFGLGLALTSEIVKIHGGYIKILDSDEGLLLKLKLNIKKPS